MKKYFLYLVLLLFLNVCQKQDYSVNEKNALIDMLKKKGNEYMVICV